VREGSLNHLIRLRRRRSAEKIALRDVTGLVDPDAHLCGIGRAAQSGIATQFGGKLGRELVGEDVICADVSVPGTFAEIERDVATALLGTQAKRIESRFAFALESKVLIERRRSFDGLGVAGVAGVCKRLL